MIFDDEQDPKARKPKARPLDNMSVPDLKEYVLHLKEEIARVEADIQKKEKSRAAADAFFKQV